MLCLSKSQHSLIKKHFYITFLSIAALAGCNLFNIDQERGEPLARAYDAYLYQEDVQGIFPDGLTPEDSLLFLENFIYKWGKQQLILQKASFNLAESEQDFDILVEEYRNDLVRFTYQQSYVNEHLDTSITEEEIQEYYEKNPQNFELKENILQADYVILDGETPDLKKVKRWFLSYKEKDEERFSEYALNYGMVHILNDTNWIPFEEVARTVPIKTYNQQQFLQKNKKVVIEDSLNVYFLNIRAFKIKDDVSPLPYVKQTVKSILLNRRKLDLIDKMEMDIFDDAYEKKDFEVY